MQMWADYLGELKHGASSGNIVTGNFKAESQLHNKQEPSSYQIQSLMRKGNEQHEKGSSNGSITHEQRSNGCQCLCRRAILRILL